MSDSEDDAADGGTDAADAADGDDFDREAERERLREKYERDQERREATEKMSELLLQGATMTNKHCDSCGSPVFRYDGEEFCPSCGGTKAVPGEDADQDGSTGAADATGESGGATDESAVARDESAGVRDDSAGGSGGTAPASDRGPTGVDATPRAAPGNDQGSEPDGRDARNRPRSNRPSLDPEGAGGGDRSGRPKGQAAGSEPASVGGRDPTGGLPQSVDEAPSLAQARASLRRAIVSLSEQAAQSDDPVRAKNLLEAASEGSEALSELGGDEV